ncbi:MAG: TlpA disulfide reductase family protein [Rariglobus sp.]
MLMKTLMFSGLAAAAMLAGVGCKKNEVPASAVSAASVSATSASARDVTLTLPVISKAADWKLKDVNGREVTAADYKGKVVVIDFWATWCPPCRKEIPEYIALQKKYAERGLVILGFSLDELPPAEVKAFGDGMGVNYPLVMANEDTVGAFGGVQGLPTAFLIDREGNVRHVKLGLADPKAYEALIVSLL